MTTNNNIIIRTPSPTGDFFTNRLSRIQDEDLRQYYANLSIENETSDHSSTAHSQRDSALFNVVDYELHDTHRQDKHLEYEIVSRIGEGTFGVVLRARHKSTGKYVALKKIRIRQNELEFFNRTLGEGDRTLSSYPNASHINVMNRFQRMTFAKHDIQQDREQHDFPLHAMCELMSFRRLSGSPYVVDIYDAFAHGSNLVLVLECMDIDLCQILQKIKERNVIIDGRIIKRIMIMILRGIDECHRNSIIHRDIKVLSANSSF